MKIKYSRHQSVQLGKVSGRGTHHGQDGEHLLIGRGHDQQLVRGAQAQVQHQV